MQILPDLRVMIVVFIVFIITMYLMNRFVFKPLINFMDDREYKINKDLKDANMENKDIDMIEKEIKDVIAQAKQQANAIIEEQAQIAKDNAKASILRIQEENKAKLDSFITGLKGNRGSVKKDILARIDELESALANKIKSGADVKGA